MDQRTLELLEFPRVLQLIAAFAVSQSGGAACLRLAPQEGRGLVDAMTLVREALEATQQHSLALEPFPELEAVFAALEAPHAVLDGDALLAVLDVLCAGQGVSAAVAEMETTHYPALRALAAHLALPAKTWSALRRCLASDGRVRDEASPELFSVRQEIRRIQQQCTRKVQDTLLDPSIAYVLQNEYLTLSSDRYVLAVKTNFKGQIRGIVHHYSQTGETCYIEPFFLVDLNNTLQELFQEERQQVRQVLEFLTGLVRQEHDALRRFFQALVRWDVLLALCAFARQYDAHLVHVEPNAPLCLRQARHPLLVAQHGNRVVPVDIELRPNERVLILSGGNAGGKTVALKTLGLAAILAHAGIPVPAAAGSTLPLWERVVVSMGDEQSLERSLSTFTSQIHALALAWPHIDTQTLVLLDEFGMGTDPSQGAALAQALVDELMERGAWVGVATHFPALKAYGLSRPGVRAASVLFCPETGRPLYRLAYDQVGASRALDVAREHGLPEAVLARARDYLYLDAGDVEEIFQRLNALAAQKEAEISAWRQEEARLRQELVRERERLAKERERVAREVRAQAQEIVRAWRQEKLGRKEALRKLAALREAGTSPQGPTEASRGVDSIARGQKLLYVAWNRVGEVQDVDARKGRVQLAVDGVTVWVPLDQVALADAAPKPLPSPGGVTVRTAPRQGSALRLDVRGFRADEAVLEVERFLDRALLGGYGEVDILHGTGTGALRRAIHDLLRRNPAVRTFAVAPADQGGEGVTTVTLGA
ncbi:endonuclease MutS2 [Thermodesulfomicrobium sp. WS]|uniref:endonuclease MutS2 n=1 Tax=Thermodesulfomicrobium sp. WS TaxID=3004129 RepID=UPI0024908338|nr:Smr/MutS family protein [Thermodesulfomicrobium sp. WS]BDV01174.1 endonuclease MutS2 [Thermodesulfomicrobium sp. WS]